MKVNSYIQLKIYEYQKNIPNTSQINYINANLTKVKGVTNQDNFTATIKQTLKELQPLTKNTNSNYGKTYNEILTRITLVKKNNLTPDNTAVKKELKKIPVEAFKVTEKNKNNQLNQTQLNNELKNINFNLNLLATPQINPPAYNQVDLLA